MKNFLKKKNEPKQQDNATAKSEASSSHKNFIQRFKKNKVNSDKPLLKNSKQPKNNPKGIVATNNTATNNISSAHYNTGTWYSLKGRIGRIQLLAFSLIWGIVFNILLLTALMLSMDALMTGSADMTSVGIGVLVILVLLLPIMVFTSIILPVRRLHDIDKSGWWMLLAIVPIANLLLLYYLYLARGNEGINSYGLPPTPYSKIELVLAIFVPVLALVSIFSLSLLPPEAQEALLPTNTVSEQTETVAIENVIVPENTELTTDESMDNTDAMEAIDTENMNTDTSIPDGVGETDVEVSSLDPETAAQVEAAMNNAINNDRSSGTISYDEFLRESTDGRYGVEEDPNQ